MIFREEIMVFLNTQWYSLASAWYWSCLVSGKIIRILTPGTGLEMKRHVHRSCRYILCLLNVWNFAPVAGHFCCVLSLVFCFLVSYNRLSGPTIVRCSNALSFWVLAVINLKGLLRSWFSTRVVKFVCLYTTTE